MSWKRSLLLCLALACLPVLVQGGDWPQFRGPDGTGLAAEEKLPTEWGGDKNIAWKAKIPGVAWSSPIVWGDKVFVTTAVSDKQSKPRPGRGGFGRFDGEDMPERPRGGFGRPGGFGRDRKPPDAVYRWEVYCLDRGNGKVLWKQTAAEKKPSIPTHSSNTYATETPITDGERVYAYFGMTGLYCYDLAGKQLWSKDLGSFKMMASFGTGASPALADGRLYIQCDNEEKSFLVCFNAKSGEELWRVNRAEKSTWSTPFIWKTKGRTEVVCCGKTVRSYDPANGKELWHLNGLNGSCNATPVADAEMLYLGASGPFSNGPLFAIKAGASGDITPKDGKTSSEGLAWSRTQSGPGMASPLLYKGYLYILEQRGGMLSCYDAKTGEPAYRRERLQGARGFTSSPWAAGDKIYCLDEDGQTFIIQAGTKFKQMGKNKLNEMFWSSPAIANGALFLRGTDHLFCIKQ